VVSEPVIPSRSRLAPESYLVTGLGVSHYLSNFEAEVAAAVGNTRIISSGSTIIRITEDIVVDDDDDDNGDDDEGDVESGDEVAAEPVAGPSGCTHRHRRRSAR
jgi:hypothetical protein